MCCSRLLDELMTLECHQPDQFLPMRASGGRKKLSSEEEEEEGTCLLAHAWLAAHFPMLALSLHGLTDVVFFDVSKENQNPIYHDHPHKYRSIFLEPLMRLLPIMNYTMLQIKIPIPTTNHKVRAIALVPFSRLLPIL